MNSKQLIKGTIIRTVFVVLELIGLVVISIITFSNDGTSAWGYWGEVSAVFITLSPAVIYVIASTVFNAKNLHIVLNNRHTIESINKYYKSSFVYLIWGTVTSGLYGLPFVFFLENIFLFAAYRKEIKNIQNKQTCLQA